MRKRDIEDAAWTVQAKIWYQRDQIWPAGAPHPMEMLDPEIAARALGVNFELHEQLGQFGNPGSRFEVAGMVNRERRLISVSRRFPLAVRRFTAAHEIGHWVMHPQEVQHRDRPVREIGVQYSHRSTLEQEADYFAACFLVPAKLLTSAFKARFGVHVPLVINEATAFFLNPQDPDALFRAPEDSLDRYITLASARHYQGVPITPLFEQFGVSVTTMAIRIKELRLVA